ncbi:hypothetical protein Mycch_2457 [Mycolicibacterium chubuense NBB4]|uniref:Uncharacterized protein n=1 Tax=Mycolicibacterium chubuense (strain NBB4) TaxID=710421 RepID=I4BIX3_MYCCN|nr:hypothetical protein [Mycolicibacterium chubuense]AFM17230.1 hypothetical protein Mycch_2457 [Mycolicibacterium chubuense NBB4]
MVTIPAAVWRGGAVRRAVTIGAAFGLCVGALAWLDSGAVAAGAVVFTVVGGFYGVWMSRRMARYWPSDQLSGADRVAVVRAVRRGEPVAGRLSDAAAAYAAGLTAAAEEGRRWRWLLGVVLVVAAVTALWDAALGSWGNAVASAVYLAALLVEVFWWPGRRARLLSNAQRAAAG